MISATQENVDFTASIVKNTMSVMAVMKADKKMLTVLQFNGKRAVKTAVMTADLTMLMELQALYMAQCRRRQ